MSMMGALQIEGDHELDHHLHCMECASIEMVCGIAGLRNKDVGLECDELRLYGSKWGRISCGCSSCCFCPGR